MSFQPSWRHGATGWYPIPAAKAACLYCHESLQKLHGLNKHPSPDGQPLVMGMFLFGSGPWCCHCAVKAWTDPNFFQRSGSSEHHASRYDLNVSGRPNLPSAEEEYRKLTS